MNAKQILRGCQVFRLLTDAQLETVAELCSEQTYESGATIIRAGSRAGKLFVVVEGKVALQMELPAKNTQLRKCVAVDVVTKGELFAWSGIVEPNVHTLSGICLQQTRVLAIDASKLTSLMREDCGTGYEVLLGIINVVASRLRDTMQLLVAERSLV